jgi:hypothetical protein
MPVAIDQETIHTRIVWLEMEVEKLQQRQATANDEQMAELAEEILKRQARLAECNDWLRILNKDPGWGELVNIAGKRIPKLPMFKSEQELKFRLENPEKTWREDAPDLSYEETARAREFNARNTAQESAQAMDGNGPFGKLLEGTDKDEEWAARIIRKLGGNAGCPNQKLDVVRQSNEES